MNKDVCKHCMERHYTKTYSTMWNAIDDDRWDKGHIACPPEAGGRGMHPGVEPLGKSLDVCIPPSWCSFKLEHCVMSGEENEPQPLKICP